MGATGFNFESSQKEPCGSRDLFSRMQSTNYIKKKIKVEWDEIWLLWAEVTYLLHSPKYKALLHPHIQQDITGWFTYRDIRPYDCVRESYFLCSLSGGSNSALDALKLNVFAKHSTKPFFHNGITILINQSVVFSCTAGK